MGLDFDRITRTTTCKQLMATLQSEDLQHYLTHCYHVLLQPMTQGAIAEKL